MSFLLVAICTLPKQGWCTALWQIHQPTRPAARHSLQYPGPCHCTTSEQQLNLHYFAISLFISDHFFAWWYIVSIYLYNVMPCGSLLVTISCWFGSHISFNIIKGVARLPYTHCLMNCIGFLSILPDNAVHLHYLSSNTLWFAKWLPMLACSFAWLRLRDWWPQSNHSPFLVK